MISSQEHGMSRLIVTFVTAICLLFSSTAGAAPRWLCVDADGTVSIEDAISRAECCDRHHEGASGEPSVEESCCHDVAISAGFDAGAITKAVSVDSPSVTLVFQPLLAAFQASITTFRPAAPPELVHESPPLSHLASIILLV